MFWLGRRLKYLLILASIIVITKLIIFFLYKHHVPEQLDHRNKEENASCGGRWDIVGARKAIADDVYNDRSATKDIFLYDMEKHSIPFMKWSEDTESLTNICNMFVGLLVKTHRALQQHTSGDVALIVDYIHRQRSYNIVELVDLTKRIDWKTHQMNVSEVISVSFGLQLTENFINALYVKLDIASNYKLTIKEGFVFNSRPWGTNWYAFSVAVPHVLALYLLVPERLTSRQADAVRIIRAFIQNPRFSLKMKRDGANSVFMFGPWLLAEYYFNYQADPCQMKAIATDEYKYVLAELKLPIRERRLEIGWHRDATYIQHETIVGWGYLLDLWRHAYIYAFDTNISNKNGVDDINFTAKLLRMARILLHPLVGTGNIGIMSRDAQRNITLNKAMQSSIFPAEAVGGEAQLTNNTLAVIPSSKVMRYFGNNFKFIVRGVCAGMGYYEADQINYETLQLWTQARLVYKKYTISVPPYTSVHGVYGSKPDHYEVVRSVTTTTSVFYPSNDSWCITGLHPDGSLAFLYQDYKIVGLNYSYSIREFIKIDLADNQSINIHLKINNRHPTQPLYLRTVREEKTWLIQGDIGTKTKVTKIRPNGVFSLKTTINPDDFENNVGGGDVYYETIGNTVVDKKYFTSPLRPRSDVYIDRKTSIMYSSADKKPLVLLAPEIPLNNNKYQEKEIINIDGLNFKFDVITNQYLYHE